MKSLDVTRRYKDGVMMMEGCLDFGPQRLGSMYSGFKVSTGLARRS